jgi:hypothetical protein
MTYIGMSVVNVQLGTKCQKVSTDARGLHVGQIYASSVSQVAHKSPKSSIDYNTVLQAALYSAGKECGKDDASVCHPISTPNVVRNLLHSLVGPVDLNAAIGIVGAPIDDDDVGTITQRTL